MNQEFENQEVEQEVDSGFEIEIEDDTPEEDRGRPRLSDEELEKPLEVPDDELQNYSEGIQKRIKSLTHRYHEERRRREEAQREREELLGRFKSEFERRQQVEETLAKGETVLVGEAKNRIEAQMSQAELAYRNAYESGDTDQILKAQRELNRLEAERLRVDSFKPREFKPEQLPEQYSRPRYLEPDDKAKAWAERNPWFQQDEEMTAVAFALHKKLTTEPNAVDPTSDEYYNRIDEGIRNRFPENFPDTYRQPASVVAPASRSTRNPRKVKLTQTQVRLAKRLGLTNEQYASQLLKDM